MHVVDRAIALYRLETMLGGVGKEYPSRRGPEFFVIFHLFINLVHFSLMIMQFYYIIQVQLTV